MFKIYDKPESPSEGAYMMTGIAKGGGVFKIYDESEWQMRG